MTHRVLRSAALLLALLHGCGSDPSKQPAGAVAPLATPAPLATGSQGSATPATSAASEDEAPGSCGAQVCTADQFCEDLYKGHALDARGRPIDRKKCMPLPDSCKAKPSCTCVAPQVASTHCSDEGGHVYINDYPVRR